MRLIFWKVQKSLTANTLAFRTKVKKKMCIRDRYITKAFETKADMDSVKAASLEAMINKQGLTFKVESKRSNKQFELTSPEISKAVGAHIPVSYTHLYNA